MIRITPVTRCLVAVFLLMLVVCATLQSTVRAAAASVVLTIKATPDAALETQAELNSSRITRGIQAADHRPSGKLPVTDTYITITNKDKKSTYLVDNRGRLYDEQTREELVLPLQLQAEMLQHVNDLRSKHYGKLISWEEAADIIPRRAKFQVKDVETGLTFHVQRRAGSSHADVQPLTKEDTAIMKQIYNGRWSWQRKAILVLTEQGQFAASMHGMPHGGDGIPDNNFAGHFCIHFLGSSTHGSGHVDPEHQLMIYKAAGKLQDYFDKASPYQVAGAFFSAFTLKDSQIFRMSFHQPSDQQMDFFLKGDGLIRGILRKSPAEQKDIQDLLLMDIPMEVHIHPAGQRAFKTRYTFHIQRASLMDPWKIASIEMISSWSEDQKAEPNSFLGSASDSITQPSV